MKKILSIFLILILISCFIAQSTYAICNTYATPTATKEISAIKLTLSNGDVLYDVKLTRDVNAGAIATSDAYKTYNLYILLDTSTSMLSKLDMVKQSLTEFINALYDYYGTRSDRLKIGIICFNDELNTGNADSIAINRKDRQSLIQEVQNMYTNNTNRDLRQAINIAYNNYEEYYYGANEDRLQSLLIITDGVYSDGSQEYNQMYQEANTTLKDLSEQMMVSMYNIEIDNNSLSGLVLANVGGLRNITTMQQDFRTNLMGQYVLEDIRQRLINIERVVPVGLTGNAQMTNNEVILYVDDELLYGATLEIEYLMTYSAGYTYISEIIDPNLSFSQDTRLLTEPNLTNKDVGWVVQNGNVVNLNAAPQTKIVLSTILMVENIPDNGYINRALVGGIATTSMITKILPPFGEDAAIADLVRIILLLISIILVLVLYKIYTRKK